MTDAQKLENRWEDLLEREIQIVKPNVILCLGNTGLIYLLKKQNPQVTKLVDKKDTRVSISPKALPSMTEKPVLIAALFPTVNDYGRYTDEREQNVVNTYYNVIRDLQTYKF